MKLLLITFSFPPMGGVGVLRALSLARYLPDEEITLHVLTARNAPAVGRDDRLMDQVPAAVTVHRTWTLDLPFALRKGLKRLLSRERPEPVSSRNRTPRGSILKRWLTDRLLPDPQIGWLPFATRAAKRIVRKEGIDAVVVTVPPFSSALLLPRLRAAFPKLRLIVDFRDEWLSSSLELISLNANARARSVAERTERAAVEVADAVVLVTETAQRALQQRYPEQVSGKFVCISNGFDTPLPVLEQRWTSVPRKQVVFTYLGSVYGATDPGRFVEAVLRLPEHLRSSMRIRFIGHIESEVYRKQLQRLGRNIELLGFLPQAEALKRMQDTDLLLLISHDPINVSAKFYDYLSSGRPIFAAVHPDGDVRRRMEETGAGWWADSADAGAMAAMLQTVVREARDGKLRFVPDEAAIAKYHRKPLARQYAVLLKSFIEQGLR